MKKQTKKLGLSKETLLDLELGQVQGGVTNVGCPNSGLTTNPFCRVD